MKLHFAEGVFHFRFRPMSMDIEHTLRLAATDWDREIAEGIQEYLETIPVDEDGKRPVAVIRDPHSGALGVHVYPLDRYSPERREEIIRGCMRVYLAKWVWVSMDLPVDAE
jgi:hypothetical protein